MQAVDYSSTPSSSGEQLSEKRALIACSRDEITPDLLARNAIAPGSLDWPWLITAAEIHGVAPTIAWRLLENEAIKKFIPEPSQARLKEIYDSALRADQNRAAEVREVLEALSQARIATVIIKGPALAIYHPRPELRFCADLDLFISEDDIPGAIAILAALDYNTAPPDGGEEDKENFTYHWGPYEKCQKVVINKYVQGKLPLPPRQGMIGVEIHGPRHLSLGPLGLIDAAEWLTVSQETELCGAPARLLPREEALLFTCYHAAGHFSGDIRRLSMLLDIHLLIQAGIDWTRFAETLKRYEAATGAITDWIETEYLAGRLVTSEFDMGVWRNFSTAQTVHYILEFTNAIYGTALPFDLIAATHTINSEEVDELCDGLGRRFLWKVPYWQRLMDFHRENGLTYDRLLAEGVLAALPVDDSSNSREFLNDLDFWRRAPRPRPG